VAQNGTNGGMNHRSPQESNRFFLWSCLTSTPTNFIKICSKLFE